MRLISTFIGLLFVVLTIGNTQQAMAQHGSTSGHQAQEHHETAKGFEPGDFIFDHIVDDYSWHIITVKGHHISVPLPVIAFTSQGLKVGMSNHWAHGHVYKGMKIPEHGKFEGQLVEVNNHGEIIGPVKADLSITKTVFAMLFSVLLLVWIFVSIARQYTKHPDQAPKGLQSFLEPLILFVRDDIARSSIGEKHYERFTPFLLTIFFFILFNNLLGLIPFFPGGANVTGNISVTMVLAFLTFIVTTISGNKNYWLHIFNPHGVPWWLKLPIPLIPFIELIGLFIKPFVLMVRLFANITAGHIIVLGFFSLIFIFGNMTPVAGYAVSPFSLLFTIFMSMLELLVAFIQAYVFTILSAIYFGMAVEEH